MRRLITFLIFLLILLQYPLWFDGSSLPDAWHLQDEIEAQLKENKALDERNRLLKAEVEDLKNGLEVVEEKARTELGLIKKGETFFQVIERSEDVFQSGAESGIKVQEIETLSDDSRIKK